MCCLSFLSILEASFLRLCLRTCDLKCVYRNSGEGSRRASGYRSGWLLSNGDSQPVRPEDDRRSGSDDLQVTKRRVCSRRGKSSEETRRRVSLFQLWVRVERCKSAGSGSKKNAADFVSSLPCNSQPPALHLVRSSAYQAFQSTDGDAQKGRKGPRWL